MEIVCLVLSICGFLAGVLSFTYSIMASTHMARKKDVCMLKEIVIKLQKRVDMFL
jgi:hypothetical protein